MHRIAIGVFSLCLLAMAGPVAARGLAEAGELEHARANARAGGPISSRDSELLERQIGRASCRERVCLAV